jgi:hypothetical protein
MFCILLLKRQKARFRRAYNSGIGSQHAVLQGIGNMKHFDEAAFVARRRAVVPHEFVLDALASLTPTTRRMFGCLAVYVEDRIVLILREREDSQADNGVWLATAAEHHASLQRQLPSMRSIQIFGTGVTHWQVIPTDAADFERAALDACALIAAGDARIGKVPKRRVKLRARAKQARR